MSQETNPQCAVCSIKDRACMNDGGKSPDFCPTKTKKEVIDRAFTEYQKPEINRFARMASIQEGECYTHKHIKPYVMHPVKPRVQEICEFAKKMGYRKLGIATCAGLLPEARTLHDILKAQGFDVVSVCCKVGCIPKEAIGLKDEEKIRIGEFESMCSPIAQAAVLNDEKTEFNILVGLCVGHDSLFFKYSEAFTTVLISKDRVLGHNPAAALYTSGTYYARLMKPGMNEPDQEP